MPTLLMTGTIAPPRDAPELAVRDVAARIDAYREALSFNLGLLAQGVIGRLVFVENSDHGMAPFADLVGPELSEDVALVSYDGIGAGPATTRFHGECLLLRHAFRIVPGLDDDASGPVFKVTGRYRVRNLAALLGGTGADFDVALHCRNRPMRYVDFGIAGFRPSRAAAFLDRVLARPGIEAADERVLREMMDEGRFEGLDVRTRLSRVPDFLGVRGSDGTSYAGLRYRLKYLLRAAAHRAMPNVWI